MVQSCKSKTTKVKTKHVLQSKKKLTILHLRTTQLYCFIIDKDRAFKKLAANGIKNKKQLLK